MVGEAQLRMRKFSDAAASFAAALASDPDNVRAQLGQVRLTAMGGKLDEAIAAVDDIVSKASHVGGGFAAAGRIAAGTGDRAGARASLEARGGSRAG